MGRAVLVHRSADDDLGVELLYAGRRGRPIRLLWFRGAAKSMAQSIRSCDKGRICLVNAPLHEGVVID